LLAAALLLVGLAGSAQGFDPPPWRGLPDATAQEWGFSTNANPSNPDALTNPYGTPTATVANYYRWYNSHSAFGPMQGFWDLGTGGTMTIELPAAQYKEVWLEVTYFQDPYAAPSVSVAGAQLLATEGPVLVASGIMGKWYVKRTKWSIDPPGAGKTIVIQANAAMGSIVDNVLVEALVDPGVIGETVSTHEEWPFTTSLNPSPPDVVDNPYGTPMATVANYYRWYSGHAAFGPVQGFWDLGASGSITIDLPAAPYVEIWVKLIYFEAPYAAPTVSIAGAALATTDPPEFVASGIMGKWYSVRTKWSIPVPGMADTIVIQASASSGSIVDGVTVDAWAEVRGIKVTGMVELDSLSPSGSMTRTVTFAATDSLGAVLKTWDVEIPFTGPTAEYSLNDVPEEASYLSAKTAWNLRRRLPIAAVDNQAVVNFTGDSKLLGGDLDGSNSINTIDYAILKNLWFSGSSVADVDGSGSVNVPDLAIMRTNWFKKGDQE